MAGSCNNTDRWIKQFDNTCDIQQKKKQWQNKFEGAEI